jgi:hypothetical protein
MNVQTSLPFATHLFTKYSPGIPNHTKPGRRIMRPNLVSILVSIFFVLVAVSATGCGGGNDLERVAVSGSVTIDGISARHGIIRFMPSEGTEGPVANTTISDGQFNIPRAQGPVAGNYEVRVHAYDDPNADHIAYPKAPAAGGEIASKNPLAKVEGDGAAATSEAKKNFNITIPKLSSFEQDFAL